jgi:hypothetical protein
VKAFHKSSVASISEHFPPQPLHLQHVDDKRHLLRLWLSPEDARPLPEHFSDLWGGVTVSLCGNRSKRGCHEHLIMTWVHQPTCLTNTGMRTYLMHSAT